MTRPSRACATAASKSVSSRSESGSVTPGKAAKAAGARILRGGAYKPRTSPYAFQGLGRRGLEILAEAREQTGLPIVTEVVDPADVPLVAEFADMLQIGTRNMANFPLLQAVGAVRKPVKMVAAIGPTAFTLKMAWLPSCKCWDWNRQTSCIA